MEAAKHVSLSHSLSQTPHLLALADHVSILEVVGTSSLSFLHNIRQDTSCQRRESVMLETTSMKQKSHG